MSPAPAAASGPGSRTALTSKSPLAAYAFALVDRYAPIHRPVLLVGPVGCGKTWLASEVHRRSGRPGQFVVLSSGATSEELFRDQLFGHVAGAFTGAVTRRVGLIDKAACGTLLLDDLALMGTAQQAALLDVLATGRFYPIGSPDERVSTARFLFASTRSLPDLTAHGALLPDLASRIGEFLIPVPALAHRSNDIMPLAVEAAIRFQEDHGRSGDVQFTTACQDVLLRHPWPRNVRELIQVVERAATHAWVGTPPVVIDVMHLPERFARPFEPAEPTPVSEAIVAEALKRTGGNQTAAGKLLGRSRSTVRRHMPARRGASGSGAVVAEPDALFPDLTARPTRLNGPSDNDDRGS